MSIVSEKGDNRVSYKVTKADHDTTSTRVKSMMSSSEAFVKSMMRKRNYLAHACKGMYNSSKSWTNNLTESGLGSSPHRTDCW